MIQVKPDGELPWDAVSWVNYSLYGKCKLTAYFLSTELNSITSVSFYIYASKHSQL